MADNDEMRENLATAPGLQEDSSGTAAESGPTWSDVVRNVTATLGELSDRSMAAFLATEIDWVDPTFIPVDLTLEMPPQTHGRYLVAVEFHFAEGPPYKVELAVKDDPTEECEGMGV